MTTAPPSAAPASLTTKTVVGRSAMMIAIAFGFIGLALLTNRKAPNIDLDQRREPAAVTAPAGASPSPFAGNTSINPYTPETANRPAPRDPLALDPDQLLRELAGRDTPTAGHVPNVRPVPSYDYDTPPPPAPSVAVSNTIGSLDMRAPTAPITPASTAVSGNALRPGDIIRVQLSGAVSSDFPGAPWMGLITQDVPFADGRVAIPAGSRIIGSVKALNGPNAVIMSRMGLASSTIVLPTGTLLSPQGYVVDADGTGAVAGRTRHHVIAQGAGVLGAAVLGAGAASVTSDAPTSTRSALEAEAASGAASQATPFAAKYLNVVPTVTLAAGQSVSVVLTAPLEIPDAS